MIDFIKFNKETLISLKMYINILRFMKRFLPVKIWYI